MFIIILIFLNVYLSHIVSLFFQEMIAVSDTVLFDTRIASVHNYR